MQNQQSGISEYGVKGPSALMRLPNYDCVRGVCSEFQHTACLGVTRQFVNTWLDSSNKDSDIYIGNRIRGLDERIQRICRLPNEISRCPRPFSPRKHWKASEYRALILYSLAILKGILPGVYLKHWFLFVFAMFNLMAETVTAENVHKADACLKKFVLLTGQL